MTKQNSVEISSNNNSIESNYFAKNELTAVLDKQAYKQGIAILSEVFLRDINAILTWEYLKDLKSENYVKAIDWIVLNVDSLYPGSNLTAMIRNKANELSEGIEKWIIRK